MWCTICGMYCICGVLYVICAVYVVYYMWYVLYVIFTICGMYVFMLQGSQYERHNGYGSGAVQAELPYLRFYVTGSYNQRHAATSQSWTDKMAAVQPHILSKHVTWLQVRFLSPSSCLLKIMIIICFLDLSKFSTNAQSIRSVLSSLTKFKHSTYYIDDWI